jgi:hypothetical protein
MNIKDMPPEIVKKIRSGVIIPAHPLALTEDRLLDTRAQNAITRYYIDAGAGGIAVGVHTTQFKIRKPSIGLLKPVLTLASETIDAWCQVSGKEPVAKIAGVCGKIQQAEVEAQFAVEAGYHACLLSLSALAESSINELVRHCEIIADIMPVVGFYLQPAVGGRVLSYDFWVRFAQIDNILAIKMAPFNRYQTLDVVRAVCDAGRDKDIALYTGNDDNIVVDLLTEYKIKTLSGEKAVRIVGGLLGHCACWTKPAVELLNKIHQFVSENKPVSQNVLTLAAEVTDANAAFFDAANDFTGCIAGIHEVLRRQGLMKGIWCLNEKENLSPGQSDEIDRVYRAYPHLNDDTFVRKNLRHWQQK